VPDFISNGLASSNMPRCIEVRFQYKFANIAHIVVMKEHLDATIDWSFGTFQNDCIA